jgi:polar amino acid transport system substrate-binding protein
MNKAIFWRWSKYFEIKKPQPRQYLASLTILLGIAFNGLLMPKAQGETVLESIKRTGVLTVAIRQDAVPFGFRDGPSNQWTGICVDFIEAIRTRVSAELGGQPLFVKMYESSLSSRYDLVAENIVTFECGPNTIRANENLPITFSRPFFVTGTQFLIATDREDKFNSNGDLQGERIGVLEDTSNSEFLAARYPKAELINFRGLTARQLGLQALLQGRIDAFASDGILLFGEALLLNIPLGQDFRFYPRNPLDCQSYGLILPLAQPQWADLVNEAITFSNSMDIYRKWLGPLFPALERVEKYCEAQTSKTPEKTAQ